jgi:hypothetical protein
MTVATSTQHQENASHSKTVYASNGGVPLEIENTETTKPRAASFSLGPRKLFMTMWNFKAFILVIWGFYSMIDSVIRAAGISSFGDYVSDDIFNSRSENKYIECFNTKESNDKVASIGYPLFFPFLVFNLVWMFWICIRSNMLYYGTDELGFHVCWVEIRKKSSYKVWVVLDAFYCVCIFAYGFQQISNGDEASRARSIPILFNGVFQVFLGLWDLYSPLEETLSYGEGAMVSPMKCSLFSEAGKAINQYQDALLAALTRDKSNMTWLEKTTGATREECEQVLYDISAKQHPSEKETKGFSFC